MKPGTIFKSAACMLCLAVVFLIPTKASAATETSFEYEVYNGEATITGYSSNGNITGIPSSIDGYPVTSIGAYAFECCDKLTTLTIPDTVKTIEEGAFRDCNNLITVRLGNGVQVVCERAFEECDQLSYVNFGQNLHTIEGWVFAYNHQLTQLDFPASLRYIGEEAFSNGTGIVSVNFREGLLSIGKNCFIFCENLTTAYLPNSLQVIDEGAFYDCEKLATVTLGSNLTTIGDCAFTCCYPLTTITIPDSVQTIGAFAFSECTNLQQVNLGSVEKIGRSAFAYCSSLTQVHIPASVWEIGKSAFSFCSSIEQMTVSPMNPYYHSDGNCIISTANKKLLFGCKNSVIPADGSVTILEAYSFAGCTGLKGIVVPDQVTRICAYTFYYCSNVEFMQLPFVGGESDYDNWLGYIFGGFASQNDLAVPVTLKRLVITGGTNINGSGFSKCYGLEEIVLPESLTTIGENAFSKCPQLQRVVVPGNLERIKSSDIFDQSPNAVLYISAGQENTKALVEANNLPYQVGGLIIFADDMGNRISTTWYPLNAKISVPVVPEKPADDRYTYEIVWEPAPDRCTGNQTIRLRYVPHRIDGEVPGDLNSDGIINSLDGLLLMRYLNGWDITIANLELLDVNCDNTINSLDGLILMRYLNGWEITLG